MVQAAKQHNRAAGSQPESPPTNALAVEQTVILERPVPSRGRTLQLGGCA
jgi:hypothetical protein